MIEYPAPNRLFLYDEKKGQKMTGFISLILSEIFLADSADSYGVKIEIGPLD